MIQAIRIEPDWNVKFLVINNTKIPSPIRIEPDWNVKGWKAVEGRSTRALE